MGQTLTHGVYLPNEGERNCYSGLASNWRLLDGAIGTVAAHTTAIAGKADISHSHGNISNDGKVGTAANKPLITGTGGAVQAGSFGNQANTFCEGNDSRLSDARTPVAHTHTKSDVTDLLNSDFIPSANNSYDLGSSSYQWNNLYAKNYYYNGTEFQSKFVTADTVQTVNGVKTFTAYVGSIGSSTGDEYSSNARTNLWLMGNRDTEEVSGILFDTYRQNTAQGTGMHILGISIKENSVRYEGCRWGWYWNNNLNGYTFDFKPTTQGANQALKHNLGTSVDKWDTLNGINPGALSLLSGGTTENTDWFNVAGDILPTGGNATSFSRETANYFPPAKDGWLALAVKNCSEISVWCESLKYGISIVVPNASVNRQTVIPVVAGKSYQILITGNSWTSARLIMPQGNV